MSDSNATGFISTASVKNFWHDLRWKLIVLLAGRDTVLLNAHIRVVVDKPTNLLEPLIRMSGYGHISRCEFSLVRASPARGLVCLVDVKEKA